MSLEIEFDFSTGDTTLRCKGKQDTDKANQEGEYFGNVVVGDRRWAIVLWDSEDDPDLCKADCLLIEEKKWASL